MQSDSDAAFHLGGEGLQYSGSTSTHGGSEPGYPGYRYTRISATQLEQIYGYFYFEIAGIEGTDGFLTQPVSSGEGITCTAALHKYMGCELISKSFAFAPDSVPFTCNTSAEECNTANATITQAQQIVADAQASVGPVVPDTVSEASLPELPPLPCSASSCDDWSSYPTDSTVSGSYSLQSDGTVVGVLPPGFTRANPPAVPGDPGLSTAIQNSPRSQLMTWNETIASPQSQSNRFSGCVTAFSIVDGGGINYKGQMAGCRRGHLRLHTYLNINGSRVQDGALNDCVISTSCSVPYTRYNRSPRCGIVENFAHGRNLTTGGDDIAFEVRYPGPRCRG